MPEEINRLVADHVGTLLLCPTQTAVTNLAREGVTEGVHMVGDVMFDAFQQHIEVAKRTCRILDDLGLKRGGYALLTIHRAENTDQPERLRSILAGVASSGVSTIFPVHPRTRAVLDARVPENIRVIEPVGYLEMLLLEANAEVIVTDSGGVQKEAYFAGRPCVTVRDTTEWTETVDAGWNVLVGSNSAAIAAAMRTFRPDTERPALFGDGLAAQRVAAVLRAGATPNA